MPLRLLTDACETSGGITGSLAESLLYLEEITNKSALGMNQAQGQSLQHVGLDFRSAVFTHGQFYVAMSRATSIHRVKTIWESNKQEPQTKNIVYQEVIQIE